MGTYSYSIPLLKNESYPTFQLFALMANPKTSPRDGLKLGALTALQWLAQRLGDNAPDHVRELPHPSRFREAGDECLRSFDLSAGFVVSVVAMPEQGIWTMQITEPDLGSDPGNPQQKRQPYPGRVFETNVGFRVHGADLECGFQIRVNEPAGAEPPPDVYRLAFVRLLVRNPDFGLRQIDRIVEEPLPLKTGVDLDGFLSLRRSAKNQLPLVVFIPGAAQSPPHWRALLNAAPAEEKAPRRAGVEIALPKRDQILKRAEMPEDFRARLRDLAERTETSKKSAPQKTKAPAGADAQPPGESAEQSAAAEKRLEEAKYFAAHLWAFGLTYLLDASLCERLGTVLNRTVEPGDVLLCEPIAFGGAVSVLSGRTDGAERVAELKKLRRCVHDYARRRDVMFGGIGFLSAAREKLRSSVKEALGSAAADSQAWASERQSLQAAFNEALDRKDGELVERSEQLVRLRGVLSNREAEIEKLRGAAADVKKAHAAALAEKDCLIEYLRDKIAQPATHAEIAGWAAEKLAGRLVLHSHAKDLLLEKGAQNTDVGLICDALHYLATDYRDARYKYITEDERDARAREKYGRRFQILPTSDAAIRRHPEQYRVKYFRDAKKNLIDSDLVAHLRVGGDAAHLLRIYFLYDDERELIVVGSLPQHLKNATD